MIINYREKLKEYIKKLEKEIYEESIKIKTIDGLAVECLALEKVKTLKGVVADLKYMIEGEE